MAYTTLSTKEIYQKLVKSNKELLKLRVQSPKVNISNPLDYGILCPTEDSLKYKLFAKGYNTLLYLNKDLKEIDDYFFKMIHSTINENIAITNVYNKLKKIITVYDCDILFHLKKYLSEGNKLDAEYFTSPAFSHYLAISCEINFNYKNFIKEVTLYVKSCTKRKVGNDNYATDIKLNNLVNTIIEINEALLDLEQIFSEHLKIYKTVDIVNYQTQSI